ncbi:MAG: fused MFS/spermidine synthase [Caulobacter sp.]|nr:fused MFS/spermidine synthase [Caulobacter sp.]
MTDTTAGPSTAATPPLFVVAVFTSAALVFMVQPMIARLVLPSLGGAPAVWNTSMAFFQLALLVGYGYAHLLQRVRTVRRQIVIHLAVLAIAGLTLAPLSISGWMGEPSSTWPGLWLMGVLILSIGLPFAALSATAPLVQAWHARVTQGEGAREPWSLYAASNLGSLLALLAYPVLVEPLASLQAQRWGWSGGYWTFVLTLAALALLVWKRASVTIDLPDTASVAVSPPPTWRARAVWVGLAALPCSLMLGVTAHLAADVASAPFLWVAPLALYLLTFIIAFQTRPLIGRLRALQVQPAILAGCAALLAFKGQQIELQTAVNLACFFLTALVFHQALVARRPDAAHLTDFYLCLSLGGVIGGAFNAFVAPVIFSSVVEYPLMLALSCLVHPWGRGGLSYRQAVTLVTGLLAAIFAATVIQHRAPDMTIKLALATTAVSVFLLRDRALLMLTMMVALLVSSHVVGDRADVIRTDRSFFGVLRQTRTTIPGLGGEVRMLAHGTTLHGAQAVDPRYRCRPLVYYAPETPIGQVFTAEQAMRPALRIGAVGLGTGSVAAYVRAGDHLTFFEIDPLVVRISRDSGAFTYTTECAKGTVDYVIGDARLTLARQPDRVFDILLIDAFSSDSVPAHLLTVEAVRGYLRHMTSDGVVILHLSNRNLELRAPAMAVAHAAGGYALLQRHEKDWQTPELWESSEDVLIIGRTAAALAPYEADERWQVADPTLARPWTDDYTNLVGAVIGRFRERLAR